MGNYNREYERYYGAVYRSDKNKNKDNYDRNVEDNIYRGYGNIHKNNDRNQGGFFRAITLSIVGCISLGALVIYGENFGGDLGNNIYAYTKEVISKDYYYKEMLEKKYDTDDLVLVMKNYSKDVAEVVGDGIQNLQSISVNNVVKKEESVKETKVEGVQHRLSKTDISPMEGEIVKLPKEGVSDSCFIEGTKKEINATLNGEVKEIENDDTLGKYVVVDHGDNVCTMYFNMGDVAVKSGDKIESGEKIGTSGYNKAMRFNGLIYKVKINDSFEEPTKYMKLNEKVNLDTWKS